MHRSDDISLLADAIVDIQANLPVVPKSSTNPHFKSMYADLPTIIEATRQICVERGVAVIQMICPSAPGTLSLETTLLHKSGQFITETLDMPIGDRLTPQAYGSAVTYARRYAYASALGIVSDQDDDGNEATSQSKATTSDIPKSTTEKISEAQIRRMNAIAAEKNWTDGQYRQIINECGFATRADVTKAKYNWVISLLEKGPAL